MLLDLGPLMKNSLLPEADASPILRGKLVISHLLQHLLLLQLPHLLQHLLLRPVEAIEDADKALAQNSLSTKAIIAKVQDLLFDL